MEELSDIQLEKKMVHLFGDKIQQRNFRRKLPGSMGGSEDMGKTTIANPFNNIIYLKELLIVREI